MSPTSKSSRIRALAWAGPLLGLVALALVPAGFASRAHAAWAPPPIERESRSAVQDMRELTALAQPVAMTSPARMIASGSDTEFVLEGPLSAAKAEQLTGITQISKGSNKKPFGKIAAWFATLGKPAMNQTAGDLQASVPAPTATGAPEDENDGEDRLAGTPDAAGRPWDTRLHAPVTQAGGSVTGTLPMPQPGSGITGTLIVNGQRVIVDQATWVKAQGALAAGSWVQVKGKRLADGSILATSIQWVHRVPVRSTSPVLAGTPAAASTLAPTVVTKKGKPNAGRQLTPAAPKTGSDRVQPPVKQPGKSNGGNGNKGKH
jgi:hypothetical protein